MKHTAFLLFSLLLLYSLGHTQPKYPVSAIAAGLLKETHVVKRLEETSFEIESLNQTVYKRKVALTILDEAGQDYASMVVDYDRLHKVANIEGALFDAAGNQVKKVKAKDISDVSANSSMSLYEDNRLKVHDFNYRNFPYTVEYEVEVTYNHTYFFPSWEPQEHQHLSVEKSSYTVVMPANYNIRYKAFHYNNEPVVTTAKDKKTMKWEVSNLSAITRPVASPPWYELAPTVLFAPSEFQMEGYKGNAASWLEYGKFQLLLNENRDKLPADVLQKVKQLTEGITNTKEKVKRLYEFMQQHTRYISIQLGIGGWQPFDANDVAQKGYGDCKALSNYMYSLLKAAGIKSYYTKIMAGESIDAQSFLEDFPSSQSNHIVLCVPLAKDTVWLECTSQTVPAGYMGSFTGNRKALAITEEGGKVVTTPHYGMNENVQVRKITGTVDEEGNLSARINTCYKAMQQDDIYERTNALSKDKLKKVLNNELDFSTYEINDFLYNAKKDVLPEVDEQLQLSVSNYATVSGRRLFIVPNLMSRSNYKNMSSEDRTCDYVFTYAYRDVDTVEINMPSGYQLETIPAETALKTSYGNYFSSVKVDGAKIFYYREMERFAGRFPAKEAGQIAKFYNAIYKADRSKVVLVKKES